MGRYNVENEYVEIQLERLFKVEPELVYQAWTDQRFLKQWFMTTERTNKSIDVNAEQNGSYEIVDVRKGKENVVRGSYVTLDTNAYIVMTIGMPELSDSEDTIEIEIFEREPGITQMIFSYTAYIPRERRLTSLEYKQKKKEYHDSTAHGFEMLFDKLQTTLEEHEEEA
ncbi:SRPBCC family protein [Staphylococcus nepalensis]|uniref:Hsp90-like protein n=1 Tax=Staphylococcus nepalensis TaxID=214473 RepID=A0A2T4SBI6_9STAP|nr:SRPBCC domain-containing protein [Staphylococcus nepalensis]VDG66360.1 Activator of Hsp90 ATPase homolog 1-like protein [Lacrimispora indolis]MBO1212768.1 SRPBCC domain-containing protein [Staphylococcus nepalensis]MBO1215787.1 SRPBCC domain-containing protein [Staphylococcus nepalensis]MBO1227157.1 SRPBCC domain-containing protein [Staphylococcus nepalensis]MBO1234857.1 SRPBCC domain-containing protein [Staphylococcus nepalensis]